MTTLTTDNNFVGKMQLSSINVQQTTVWSMVMPGKILCPVEKCHILVNQSNKSLLFINIQSIKMKIFLWHRGSRRYIYISHSHILSPSRLPHLLKKVYISLSHSRLPHLLKKVYISLSPSRLPCLLKKVYISLSHSRLPRLLKKVYISLSHSRLPHFFHRHTPANVETRVHPHPRVITWNIFNCLLRMHVCQFPSFSKGSSQWNVYVLVLTAGKSHTWFWQLFYLMCGCICALSLSLTHTTETCTWKLYFTRIVV